MKFSQKEIISHTVVFCLGALLAYGVNDYVHTNKSLKSKHFNKLQAKTRSLNTPTGQFDRMFQSLDKVVKRQALRLEASFSTGVIIEEEEDQETYRVLIKGKGIDKDSLKIDINSGILQITGQVTREEKSSFGFSRYSSSFSRTVSIPISVDIENPTLSVDGQIILIEFQKL